MINNIFIQNQKLTNRMLYSISIRIKIISCLFNQKQLSKTFTLKCYSNDKIIQSGFLNLKDGFITNNISLNMKIKQQQLTLQRNIKVVMFEKKKINSQVEIGYLVINLHASDNYKLRKIKIESQIYKNAFIQAFVLIFPIQNVQQEQCIRPIQMPVSLSSIYQSNVDINKMEQLYLKKDIPVTSLVNIFYQDNQDQQKVSYQPQIEQLKICYKNQKKASIMSNEAQTQTHNIQSLLTLNNILQQQNSLLQNSLAQYRQKNKYLQSQVLDMSSKIQQLMSKMQDLELSNSKLSQKDLQAKAQRLQVLNKQNQNLIQELNDKIKRFQRKNEQNCMMIQTLNATLISKNEEISNKKSLIIDLTKKCKQLQINICKTQRSVDIQNKAYSIDQIVLQLSKYSQTVKKYKNMDKSNSNRNSLVDSRLKQLKTSRVKVEANSKPINFIKPLNRKQQNRNLIENKQRFNNEQTAHSLTESKFMKYA